MKCEECDELFIPDRAISETLCLPCEETRINQEWLADEIASGRDAEDILDTLSTFSDDDPMNLI